jgi:8-oxo-dGTP pyrophosphatase MutT (NUDIX family)
VDLRARIDGRVLSEIDGLTPVATGSVVWGVTPLVLTCYLTEKQPPLDLIVSARAVLTRGEGKIFVFDDNGPRALPGGHRERAEPVLDALAREIREEVGCSIVGVPRPLGFFELRDDGPRPEAQIYPYPINYHVVFSAVAGPLTSAPEDPNVHDGRFVSNDEALALDIPWAERVFLEAAQRQST